MNRILPKYLLDKFQLIGNTVFCVLFAIIFLSLFIPFSTTAWFRLGYNDNFFYTVAFITLAMAVIFISRLILFKTRYLFEIRVWQYLLWCFVEMSVICIFYVFLTVVTGNMPEDFSNTRLFMKSLLYGSICLLIPNVIASFYIIIAEKEKILRLMNYKNVVTDEPEPESSEQKITLFDIAGTLRFSVRSSSLYYIEADDNYIKVWYDDADRNLRQYIVRSRMKTVEEAFKGSSLVRCHRKYIVNTDHLKVLYKKSDSFYLELDNVNIPPIPVTKTYEKNLIGRFCPEESGTRQDGPVVE